MIVLMVRVCTPDCNSCILSSPALKSLGEQMYTPFWEAIGRLERCGVHVMAHMCGALAVNRCLFQLRDQSQHPKEVYKSVQ